MQTAADTLQREHAMVSHGMGMVHFDTFSSKKEHGQILWSSCDPASSEDFADCSFTGKERDEETGYGYFGARYMDHELMTMWLSVDPMADKYPSISPYAYCAWNPVKLIDPDGRDLDEPPAKWKTIEPVIPKKDFVGWNSSDDVPNCNDYARKQIDMVNCSATGADHPSNLYPFKVPDGVNDNDTKMAINYIQGQLDKGIPVMVGVETGEQRPDRNNGTTDHFIVIVGQGSDDNGNYFRYYDNRTSSREKGTSDENKLYHNQEIGTISGPVHTNKGTVIYYLSEVRRTWRRRTSSFSKNE